MKPLKKIFLLTLLLAAFSATNAQVKISQMPALGTGLDSMEFPVIKNNVNYRVSGRKFVINQMAKRQAASAWIDTFRARFIRVDSADKFVVKAYNVGNTGSGAGGQGSFPVYISSLNDSSVTEGTAINGIRSDVIYDDQIHNSWYTRYGFANSFNQTFRFRAKTSVQIQNDWGAGNYGWANVNATKNFTFGDSTYAWLRNNNVLMPTPNFYSDVTTQSLSSTNRFKHLTFSLAGYLSWARLHYTADTIGAFYNFMAASPASNANGTKLLNYYGFYAGAGPSTAVRRWGFYSDGPSDENYFAGKLLIGDNSALNADVHKLYVAGSAKITGNILGTGRTLLGGAADDGATALQTKGFSFADDYGNSLVMEKGGGLWSGGKVSLKGAHWYLESQNGQVILKNANATAGTPTMLTLENKGDVSQPSIIRSFTYGNASTIVPLKIVTVGFGNDKAGDIEIMTGVHTNDHTAILAGQSYKLKLQSSPLGKVQINAGATEVANADANGFNIQTVINLAPSAPPASSADASGRVGDVRRGTDGALYMKTDSGWLKFTGASF